MNRASSDVRPLSARAVVSQALWRYSCTIPLSVERVFLGYMLDIQHLSSQYAENKEQIPPLLESTTTNSSFIGNSSPVKEYLTRYIDRGIEDLLTFMDNSQANRKDAKIEDNDLCPMNGEFPNRILSFLLPFYTCIWLLKDGGGRGGSILFNPSLLQAAKSTTRGDSSSERRHGYNSQFSLNLAPPGYSEAYYHELERLVSLGRERRHRLHRLQNYDPLFRVDDEDAEEELLLRDSNCRLHPLSNCIGKSNSAYHGIQLDSKISTQILVTDFLKDMVHYPEGEVHVSNGETTSIYKPPSILLLFITLENILGVPGKSLWGAFCNEVNSNSSYRMEEVTSPQPIETHALHEAMSASTRIFFNDLRNAAVLDGNTITAPFYPFAVIAELASELSREGISLEATLASNQEASLSIKLMNNTTNTCHINHQYRLLLRAYLMQIPERLLLCTPTSLRRKVAAQRGCTFHQVLQSAKNETCEGKANPQHNGALFSILLDEPSVNDEMFLFSNNINNVITSSQGRNIINTNLSNKVQNSEIILHLCIGSVSLFNHPEAESSALSRSLELYNVKRNIDISSKSQGDERISQLHLLLDPILEEIRWYQQCIFPLSTNNPTEDSNSNLITKDSQRELHTLINRFLPMLIDKNSGDTAATAALSECKHPVYLKAINSLIWTQTLLSSCGCIMPNPSLQSTGSMDSLCDHPRKNLTLESRQLNLLQQFLKVLTTPIQRSVSFGESTTTSEATPIRALLSFRCQTSPQHLNEQLIDYCACLREDMTNQNSNIRGLSRENNCFLKLLETYEGRKSLESSMWKSLESVFELVSANKFAVVLARKWKRQQQSEVDNINDNGKSFSRLCSRPQNIKAIASLETLKLFVEVMQRQTDSQNVNPASSNSEDETNSLGRFILLNENLTSSTFRNVTTRGSDIFSTLASSYGNSVFFLWGTNLIKRRIEYLRLESNESHNEHEETTELFSDKSIIAINGAKEKLLNGYGQKGKAAMSYSKHLSTADVAHKLFFGSAGSTIQGREQQKYEIPPRGSTLSSVASNRAFRIGGDSVQSDPDQNDNEELIYVGDNEGYRSSATTGFVPATLRHSNMRGNESIYNNGWSNLSVTLSNGMDISRCRTHEAFISYWEKISHKHGPLHTATVRGNVDTLVSIIDGCLDTITNLFSNERQLARDAIIKEVNCEIARANYHKSRQKEKLSITESCQEVNLGNSEYDTANTNFESVTYIESLLTEILYFVLAPQTRNTSHLRTDGSQLYRHRATNSTSSTPLSPPTTSTTTIRVKDAAITAWSAFIYLIQHCCQVVFGLCSEDNNPSWCLLFLRNSSKTIVFALWNLLSRSIVPLIWCGVKYFLRIFIGNRTFDFKEETNVTVDNDALTPEPNEVHITPEPQSRTTTYTNQEEQRRENSAEKERKELQGLEDYFTKLIRKRVKRTLPFEASDLLYRLGAASTEALRTALLHGKLDMALAIVASPEVIVVEVSPTGIISRIHDEGDAEAKPSKSKIRTENAYMDASSQLRSNSNGTPYTRGSSSITNTTTKVVYFKKRNLPIYVSQSIIDCATSTFSNRLKNIPINFLEDLIKCNYSYLRFRFTFCSELNGFSNGQTEIGRIKGSITNSASFASYQITQKVCPVMASGPDSEETKHFYIFEEAIKVARLLSILRTFKDSQEIDGPFVPYQCKQHILYHEIHSNPIEHNHSLNNSFNVSHVRNLWSFSVTDNPGYEIQYNSTQRERKSFYVIDPLLIDPVIGRQGRGCTCLSSSAGRPPDECHKRTKALLAFVYHPYVQGHSHNFLVSFCILFIFYFVVYIGLCGISFILLIT